MVSGHGGSSYPVYRQRELTSDMFNFVIVKQCRVKVSRVSYLLKKKFKDTKKEKIIFPSARFSFALHFETEDQPNSLLNYKTE